MSVWFEGANFTRGRPDSPLPNDRRNRMAASSGTADSAFQIAPLGCKSPVIVVQSAAKERIRAIAPRIPCEALEQGNGDEPLNRQGRRCIAPTAWLLGLLLLAAGPGHGASLDIDGDGAVSPATDGQLILRHLFGFSGQTLIAAAVGPDAVRDTAAIEGHLGALGLALDVDGDGKADALTDGVLILRYLLGRTGADLVGGAVSSQATRAAEAIADRIDALSTPPGEAPASVELVQANSLTANSIQLDWLPTFDNDTPGSGITYVLHASETDNFIPEASTARTEVVNNATGVIQAVKPATQYYVKVEARDSFGHASWSNQLNVLTAAADPQDTAAPRQVLDEVTAPVQTVEPDRVDYQLGAGASAPQVGDILVSGEGNGFLRRAAAVSQVGDQVSIDTEPAALNELYDNLSVSTDVKLIDLPETAGPQARAVGRGVIFQRSGDTKRAVWPDTGLTLIEQRPAEPVARAAQPAPASCDGVSGERVSNWDRPLKVTYPQNACVEPDGTLEIPIDVEIELGLGDRYQITQLFFEKLTHPKVTADQGNYGAIWSPSLGDTDIRGTGLLRWTPQERHVDDQGRPYTAHFVALAKERAEYCRGVLDFCGERKIEFEVDIYVAWGTLSEPGEQSFTSADAGIEISGTAKVDFQPRIRTDADITGGRLRSGQVLIEGPISFTTEVNLRATASGQHQSSKQLIDKRFVKVFYAGSVPIVITGRFQLGVQFRAEADAALDITQTLTTGYDIQTGLEYRDGGWHLIKEAEPWQRYKLSGEADTHAYVELRFVPDLELTFYDVATGRLIVEPYLFAEAALEGHFLYQVQADGSGVTDGGDADYRFTKLEFGAGVDGKFRAGLEAFDRSIVGYPSRDQNDFLEFALLNRTPIIGLPALTPRITADTSAGDCTAVGLTADIANVANPFQGLFGGPDSWNPFANDSAAWEVVLPAGTERIASAAGSRDAWFSAAAAGQYRLRFSGHSGLGSYVRQYEEITLDYDPAAQDCSAFGTLRVDPPGGAWTSSPQSISISGADVETIYYTAVDTYDGTTPADPPAPTPATNDGMVTGPNATMQLRGSEDQLRRTKLSLIGCTAGQCGPVTGPYEYRIDLRPGGQPGPTMPLNDTGITTCANASQNGLPCPVAGFPEQDAQSGRDVTHSDDSDGHAGFSFTKLDANGNPLAASAANWSCVHDNVTGLIWEVKTDDGGLRDKDWTYSWYNPDGSTNGGSAGYSDNGNNCFAPVRCDTEKFVADVNAAGLCGARDWRLPSQFELLSIVNNNRYNPAIDTAWLPLTQSGWFWSSSPYARSPSPAWVVYFDYGYVDFNGKVYAGHVRLVRGGQ